MISTSPVGLAALPEPISWECGDRVLTAEWLTAALHSSGEIDADAEIRSFEYDPVFVRRGEGDRLRRVLLQMDRGTSLTSLFVKELDPYEAGFYKVIGPLVAQGGVRLPRVIFCGQRLLLLEDLAGTHWDEVDEMQFQQLEDTGWGRIAKLVATYARFHSATWGRRELAATVAHDGDSLAREIIALCSWRRAVAQPWLRDAVRAAAAVEALGPHTVDFVLAVAPQWANCEELLKQVACVVHGDAHGGNVIDLCRRPQGDESMRCECRDAMGYPALLDFEFAAFGHPAWDLAVLIYHLWARDWTETPAAFVKMVADAYVEELWSCGIKVYGASDCFEDVCLALPLAFVGFTAERVAETFEEWWNSGVSDHDFEGRRLPVAGQSWMLERALESMPAEVLARLPASVCARYSSGAAAGLDDATCVDIGSWPDSADVQL